MSPIKKRWIFTVIAILLLIVMACSVSLNNKEEEISSAEQTLQIVSLERTQTAIAASLNADAPAESDDKPAIVVNHTITPGNPGSPDVEKNEIDTKNTAGSKTALGDSFRLK